MGNFILATNYGKSNIADKFYYAMSQSDLAELVEEVNIGFGDKVYIITSGEMVIRGNDEHWYKMDGTMLSESGGNSSEVVDDILTTEGDGVSVDDDGIFEIEDENANVDDDGYLNI